MIMTAQEFVALRTSARPEEYLRAANEELASDVWLELIHSYPEMKKWAAHNKTVPVEILSILAADADPAVRYTVAMKNKLTPELMLRLSQDPDTTVRHRIACNKNVPADILECLAKDTDELVSSSAWAHLRRLKQ